jgi:hypothetical protein
MKIFKIFDMVRSRSRSDVKFMLLRSNEYVYCILGALFFRFLSSANLNLSIYKLGIDV